MDRVQSVHKEVFLYFLFCDEDTMESVFSYTVIH